MPSRSESRSTSDEELRLPRAPGVIRQFWARHPLLTDILIAGFALIITAGTSGGGSPQEQPVPPLQVGLLMLSIVAGSVLLVWRRRMPVVVLVAAIVADVVLLIVMRSGGSPLLAFAVYALAVYRSTRAAWIGLATATAVPAAVAFAWWAAGGLSLQTAVNATLAIAVPGLIAVLIGINIGNRRRYLAAVIDRSRQLLVERDQQAQLAAAAERDRIAREIHDIVSHSLTVVVALSEGAAATDDRARSREASLAAASTARSALTEMRSMLGVLRGDDDGTPLTPLEPTTPAATVQAAQQAGFAVSLAVRGEPATDPALRFAIGRIVQEGVTNAIRHAPMASAIDVRIDYDASQMIIEIVNDGAPAQASEGGFGLRGLAERAALLGGILVSAPAGSGRWMLRAELPHGGTHADASVPPLLSDAAPAQLRDSAGAGTASRGEDERAEPEKGTEGR